MAYNTLRASGLMPEQSKDSRIVALYTRVSTGYQIDKDSLPQQKKELTAYCEHVLHVAPGRLEIFEDAEHSGKNTDRPAFQRMMNKVHSGLVSHIIVCKIDRISRNLVDFSIMYEDLKYNRVAFISLNEQFDTSTAMRETMLKIILVFAELERKLTSERVTDVMIGRAMDGKWNGARVPFGWDWDSENGIPVHHDIEASIGRSIYDMHEKCHSTVKIRQWLNENKIDTKRGGEWTTKTIADFIRNPMNKGDHRYNYRESARGRKKPDEEVVYVKGVFPPLVPVEQWERCNAIMDKNSIVRHQIGFEKSQKYIHLFSGCLKCADCGYIFHSNKDKQRSDGFTPSTYRCGGRSMRVNCQALGVTDITLGDFVFNFIHNLVIACKQHNKLHGLSHFEKLLLSGDSFKNVIGIDKKSLENMYVSMFGIYPGSGKISVPNIENKTADISLEKYEQEITKLERALERLKKAFLFDDNALDEKEYLSTKVDLETKLVDIKNKLAGAKSDAINQTIDKNSFITAASSFLIANSLQNSDSISFRQLSINTDKSILRTFVKDVIDMIYIKKGQIQSIVLKNGIECRYLYKD